MVNDPASVIILIVHNIVVQHHMLKVINWVDGKI